MRTLPGCRCFISHFQFIQSHLCHSYRTVYFYLIILTFRIIRYSAISKEDLTSTILNPLYPTSSGIQIIDVANMHSHRLAAFFAILATGSLYETDTDLNLNRADSATGPTLTSSRYYALSRAAVSLDSIFLEVTCATVQALFVMMHFLFNTDRSSNEEKWLLTGITVNVAQSVSR